jgi:hypothetical protein
MNFIANKTLVGDRAKFIGILIGLTSPRFYLGVMASWRLNPYSSGDFGGRR